MYDKKRKNKWITKRKRIFNLWTVIFKWLWRNFQNIDIKELYEKYEPEILQNLNDDNVLKIVEFLVSEQVDYIDELFNDYLDLFIIDYNEFINRFNNLKQKYGEILVELISNDLSILDEF